MKEKAKTVQQVASPAEPTYFLGLIGALVYYIQLADNFWQIVVACLKALVWPAFLVYDLLKFIA
jgi:hypothetical protein